MTTATSWRVRGDVMDGCSCNVTCPCTFGGDPTRGFCEGVLGLHIQEGNYGPTQLDGLNVVLYLRSPGKMFEGHWTLGTYLDQRATEEQMQALGTILSGQAGGMFAALGGLIETALPPKQVPINYEIMDGEYHITVPGLLELGSERIPNPMPGQPPLDTKARDVAHPFFTGEANIRRTSTLRLTDPNLSFEHTGHSAVTGHFDYSGP